MRALPLVLMICACHRDEPAWSRAPATHLGEDSQKDPLPIPRCATPPVLDGKLDDACWANAATLGPFVDTFSGAAQKNHPVAAFARAAWDDQNLYVAFVVRDKSPSSPFGKDDADPHIWGKSSGIELMLQPGDFDDNRGYYEIQVDVGRAIFDTRWDDYMIPTHGTGPDKIFGHMDWSSGIERAVQVMAGHFYTVELALPWSRLSPARTALPPKPGDVWHLNLYSFRDGQRLALGWSPIRGQGNFHKSARWGKIRFAQ